MRKRYCKLCTNFISNNNRSGICRLCLYHRKRSKFKTHFFSPDKENASLCMVNPSVDNFYRNKYCTKHKHDVTCKKCLQILRRMNA